MSSTRAAAPSCPERSASSPLDSHTATPASIPPQDNGISDAGAVGLASALAVNRALRHLNVANNGVGPQGASALSAVLGGSSVTELNLAGNPLGPLGAKALAGALRENTALLEVRVGLDRGSICGKRPLLPCGSFDGDCLF